jgi:hypothetical protein
MEKISYPCLGREVLDCILRETATILARTVEDPIIEGTLVYQDLPVSWRFRRGDEDTGRLRFAFRYRGRIRAQFVKVRLSTGQVISRSSWLRAREGVDDASRSG